MVNSLDFLMAHWILSSLFVVTLLILLVQEWIQQKQGLATLSPQELTYWMNHDEARVIDLRSSELFYKGHIAGSVFVEQGMLSQVAATWPDKATPVVVVCSSGAQAAKGALQLRGMGFAKVAILSGGIASWQSDNLPLVKKG